MNKISFKRNSIFFKIIFPVFLLVCLLFLIIYISLITFVNTVIVQKDITDTSTTLDVRNEHVATAFNDYTNIGNMIELINDGTYNFLKKNGIEAKKINDLDEEQKIALVREHTQNVISMLKRNTTTDAFLFLDDGAEHDKVGIYLRTNDPRESFFENSNVSVEVSPYKVCDELASTGYGVSQFYETKLLNSLADEVFSKPREALKSYPTTPASLLGYWKSNYTPHANQSFEHAIVKSFPLIIDDFYYGVIGVGFTTSFCRQLLSLTDYTNVLNAAYVISHKKNGALETVAMLSNFSSNIVNGGSKCEIQQTKFKNTISVKYEDMDLYAISSSLKLYSDNSPYLGEEFYLIVVLDRAFFSTNSSAIIRVLTYVFFPTFIIMLFILLYISRRFVKPIISLSTSIRDSKTTDYYSVNIDEIDVLLTRIKSLVEYNNEGYDKMRSILETFSNEISIFDYSTITKKIRLFGDFFGIVGIDSKGKVREEYDEIDFSKIMEKLNPYIIERKNTKDRKTVIYKFNKDEGTYRYTQLIYITFALGTVGVATDVTDEYLSIETAKTESGIDALTGLLNRRGFERMALDVQESGNVQNGAIVMLDLDHLKTFNDQYGHLFGDYYIIHFGEALNSFKSNLCDVVHISGDEFILFYHDYESIAKLKKDIKEAKEKLDKGITITFNNTTVTAKSSSGVAYYTAQLKDYQELIRFADFAMYQAKKKRGENMLEFNKKDYLNSLIVSSKTKQIHRLLDEELIYFVFHPIVCIKTGEIFGYEALMRSKLAGIKTPLEILEYAKNENRLTDLENVCVRNAIIQYAKQKCDKPVFINSIASTIISKDTQQQILSALKTINFDIIIEMTEEELSSREIIQQKEKFVRECGFEYAIDDYGIGYSNLSALLDMNPSYIKIDISLVKNVIESEKVKSIIRFLKDFSLQNKIKLIAEGVEKLEQIDVLYDLDVDYIQGYLISKPSQDLKNCPAEVKERIKQISSKTD